MGSSKIQEYNLDPNMGLAKEDTSQKILGKVGSVAAQVQKKCTASNNVVTTLINSAVTSQDSLTNAKAIAKILIKNSNGTVRVTASLKNASSEREATLYASNMQRESGGGNVSVTGSSYQTVTMDVIVSDGDVLYFYLTTNYTASSSYQAYCNLLSIGCDFEELTEDDCIIVVG